MNNKVRGKKIISMKRHEEGICPVCLSHELEYGNSEVDGGQMCYIWVCKKCKSTGREWYSLTFVEHTISK